MKKAESSESDRYAQLALVRDRIYGNEAINRIRQQLNSVSGNIWQQLDRALDERDSITEVTADARQAADDWTLASNMMAKFRFNGQPWAENELRKVLFERFHTVEDEKFPPQDLQSFTLYILEYSKTLKIIHTLGCTPNISLSSRDDLYFLREELYSLLPSLSTLQVDHAGRGCHTAFMAAYVRDIVSAHPVLPVLSSFAKLGQDVPEYPGCGTAWKFHAVKEALARHYKDVDWNTYSDLVPGFVFLVQGGREETLSLLGDPQGQTLAAWEFRLPSFMASLRPHAIGLGRAQKWLNGDYLSPRKSINEYSGLRALLFSGAPEPPLRMDLYIDTFLEELDF